MFSGYDLIIYKKFKEIKKNKKQKTKKQKNPQLKDSDVFLNVLN